MLNTIKETLARSRRIRETRRELEKLSDRELADIGITRWDIPTIAAQA